MLSALDHAEISATLTAAEAFTPANVVADRFLHLVLFVSVLSSFYILVEPAPYDYLMVVLGFACVLARVSINRVVLPLLVLLLIRDASGALGLLKILNFGWVRLAGDPIATIITFDYPDSIRFLAISFYLGLSAVMYACISAQDTMRRIKTIRAAFILSAVIASALGMIGYFKLIPGLDLMFTDGFRISGGFKGPNDFAGFMVPALLWLIEGFMLDRIRIHNLIASIIIFIGLLLSFSRGGWGSFFVTAIMMVYLLFVTQRQPRIRRRIAFQVIAGVVAAMSILAALSSVDTIRQSITERSQVQDYDVNGDNRSRLNLEVDSFKAMFDHPLGMGPWGFAHATNWVSHETFIGTALNHGWVGGAAYLTLIVLTLYVGFRSIWTPAPWQAFLIATYAAFIAMVFEGIFGDTDHWRHFYIVLGLVWGLAAATQKHLRAVRYAAAED